MLLHNRPLLLHRFALNLTLYQLKHALSSWRQSVKLHDFIDHRNQNQLEDILLAWKKVTAFKGGHSIYHTSLKHKVFTALQKHKMHVKVKKYRYSEAQAHRNLVLLRSTFALFQESLHLIRLSNQRKLQSQKKIDTFRRIVLLDKSIKAWKLVGYRIRV